MTDAYAVIGCSDCGGCWIIRNTTAHDETVCPACGTIYARPGAPNPTNRPARVAIDTADTHADARACRATQLLQTATGVGDAHVFDIEDADSYAELADRVDTTLDESDPSRRRLEAETGLDADALAAYVDDRDTTAGDANPRCRAAGQPELTPSRDASAELRRRRFHRCLLEHRLEQHADGRDPFTDARLKAAGVDPDYVADAAARTVAESTEGPDDERRGDDEAAAGDVAAIDRSTTGLRLTYVDDLPATADIVLTDVGPRFSEWLGDWTEACLPDLETIASDLLRSHGCNALTHDRVPRTATQALIHEHGITALDGLYVDALTRFAVERHHVDQYAATLTGIGDPASDVYDGLGAVASGPVAALRYRDHPVETVVELDTDAWLDLDDRDTGIRALQALATIAESSRVYLGYDSWVILDDLAERYGDYLEMAGINLVDERDAARSRCPTVTPDADADARRDAYTWLGDARDDTQPVRLVKTLARAPGQTLTRDDILAHADVQITENSFYPVKDDLATAGVATYETRRGPGQASRLTLTTAGQIAAAHITDTYTVQDPLQRPVETDLTPPHTAPPSTVGSRDQRSGGRGDGSGGGEGIRVGAPDRSPESWLAEVSTAGFRDTGGDEGGEYVHWLNGPGGAMGAYGMHKRLTAPVIEPGVHLVDEPIEPWGGTDGAGDGRATFISEQDGEFLVVAEAALDPLVTLGRFATTLLDSRVLAGILTESELGPEFEQVYDGAWESIEAVESVDDLHAVLRDGVQLGWKSADERTVAAYRDRLQGLRSGVLSEVATCTGLDRGADRRTTLFEDLHGIIASMTQLTFASGRHVVFNLRVPRTRTLRTDEVYRRDLLGFFQHTVPKQAVFCTPSGWHSWTRQTQETRPEKLKWRRPPGLEEGSVESRLTASWVVTGPSVTAFESSVRRAVDAGVREWPDGGRAPPALEVPVRDATQPPVLAAVIESIAGEKNYDVANLAAPDTDDEYGFDVDAVAVDDGRAEDITRLLRVCLAAFGDAERPLAASPCAVAEALLQTAGSTRVQDHLRVRDLEYGLSQVSPTVLFPELGPVATSMVQVLLASDEALRPAEIVAHSISAAESMRTWESVREELLALGIVEERPAGAYPHYTATLEPWWSPATSSSRPPNVDEGMLAQPREHEMLFEISTALGLELEPGLFTWTGPTPPDVGAVYDASAVLRRWRPVLAAAFASREDLLDLPPPSTSSEREEAVVVLGRPSGAAAMVDAGDGEGQVSLQTSMESAGEAS